MVLNRFANAWNVLISSLSFIKRDKSLVIIPILMLFSNVILIILFSILFLLVVIPLSNGTIILVGIAFVIFIYIFNTLLASAQSWMVYEVAKGKNTTLYSGLVRALKNTKDIVFFSIASFVVSIIIGIIRGKKDKGITSAVRGAAADIVSFATGIAKKLVLPAMIVTDKNFWESVKNLKTSIKATPEILIYEIGIKPIITTITFIFFILCGILVWVGFLWTGITVFVIAIVFIGLLSSLINQIYYTLIYLVLIEKKKIKGINIK